MNHVRIAGRPFAFAVLLFLAAIAPGPGRAQAPGLETVEKHVRRASAVDGRAIVEIDVSGRPPAHFRMQAAMTSAALGDVILTDVPAFDWCYGCSATAAAMMMGYYDNNAYFDMYLGPTNGGVCPLTNSDWGYGECPLSATHQGYDGRSGRGNVDDYWITYLDFGPDPYILNGWPEHSHGDCTADFMGTNQSKFGNVDGGTTFWCYTDGTPLYDYIDPYGGRDGCHGLRLFVESRGYGVIENFTQFILGYNGNALGFSFEDYVGEIDAGRPVIIQVSGHSMLGYGYNRTGNMVYLRDTWDHEGHSMTWGDNYYGMQHYGVTVLRLEPRAANNPPTADSQSATTAEDIPAAIVLTGEDIDGDALTFTVVGGPSHGSLSGAAPYLVYTPAADYSGSDAFTFTASDGQATSGPATVTIAVLPVDDPPAARDDSYRTSTNKPLKVCAPGVLSNDSDPEGGRLTAVLAGAPAHGTLSLRADGSFAYKPRSGFVGTDSFTYRARTCASVSAPATVTITVTRRK